MFALSILVVLVAVAAFFLGLFALLRNHHDSQNLTFFIFTLLLGAWTLFNFFGSNIVHAGWTELLVLSDFASGIFLAWAFWLFARVLYAKAFQRRIAPAWVLLSLIANSLIAVLCYANQVVAVGIVNNELQLTNETFYIAYVLLAFFYLGTGLFSLIVARWRAAGQKKAQFSIILYGLLAAALLVSIPNLILPSILGPSLLLTFTENLAYFGILFFAVMASYAIAKHRLFDIRLIVARSVAYTMLLTTLAVAYGVSAFAFSNLLFSGTVTSAQQQIIYVSLAIVLAFTFQHLRRFFEKITDKLFYRDRYDSSVVLNQLSTTLAAQIDINIIIHSSLELLGDTLKLAQAKLVVMDESKIYRTAEYGKGSPHINAHALELLHSNLIIADELEGGHLKEFLEQHSIAASLRLKTQEGVVGYVLLGPKQSGGIYSNQDAHLLEIIGNELAVAVQNARSFEKIADFNLTLQQRIKEATKRLSQQNQRLKELDEAKDEFISMASHQLRTPLTAIKGYLSMLGEGDAGKLNEKQYEFMDLAYTSAERMVYLISDMLNVSRINTGKLVVDRAAIDLTKTVQSEIRQLQRTATARGVELQFSPRKLPQLNLDEGKMRQVIMNFLDNAIYYAPNSKVEINLEQAGEKVRFSVKDHGIGVPKADQKNLFAKFYRAGNAKKARPDGTGLGLYMARIVVELQGGSLIFHSQEGKGSTFGFEFPLSAVKVGTKTPTKELAAAKA